jgi:hypothetical protein
MHQAFYEQLAAERTHDLLKEAEGARLVRAASGPHRHPVVGRSVMGAGERLFRWGARLMDDCDTALLSGRGADLSAVADRRTR